MELPSRKASTESTGNIFCTGIRGVVCDLDCSFLILQLIQDTMAKWLIRAFPLCSCLDTRQPGNVFKKLDTQQSEILTNFHEIACSIPLRTQDICLAISSNCTYCFRLKVEVAVELGHMVKCRCFRHLENI